MLEPALQVPGIAWYSVKATGSTPAGANWNNVSGQIRDVADHAALLANMDLVIAVDGPLAHLAGAMGLKVWTVLPLDAGWRWLFDKNKSPWYPSMHCYHQQDPRNGDVPARQMAAQLQRILGLKHTAALAEAALR
jgi:ADP-heptose:LPS heptosyltransferase